MLWILLTIFAALMQSVRNALQKELSSSVSMLAATLARFLYASPLAALYLFVLYQNTDTTTAYFKSAVNWRFALFVFGAAVLQILATALMVTLFKQRNYAIGVGLAKSEAIFAAVLGMLFFATTLSWLAWLGVLVGFIAILLLSGVTQFRAMPLSIVLMGMGCGSAFAITSLWVREASLALPLPFPINAGWVLFCVISVQSILLLALLLLREPQQLKLLWQKNSQVLLTSVCSCAGSIGWFSAMALVSVPLVKTLGQIEMLFTLLWSACWFKEPLRTRDIAGLVGVSVAAILVLWP